MKIKDSPVREKLVKLEEIDVVLSGIEGVDLDAPFTEEEIALIEEAIAEGVLLLSMRRIKTVVPWPNK